MSNSDKGYFTGLSVVAFCAVLFGGVTWGNQKSSTKSENTKDVSHATFTTVSAEKVIAEERLGITNIFDFARDSVYMHRMTPGRGGGHGHVSAISFCDITNADMKAEFNIAVHMIANRFTQASPALVTDTIGETVKTITDLKTGVTSTDTTYETATHLGMKYER